MSINVSNSIADILILSNGPGEVTTWVRPVVQALRQQSPDVRVRISVVLSPCPHATGKEAAIALSYGEVDRVQGPEYFISFLLWGKTADNWDWSNWGVVVFLGGDQFFPVVIARRLGYRTVVYAEWDARWHGWIDRFGVIKPEIAAPVKPKFASKFTVVGDLMADVPPHPYPHPQGWGYKDEARAGGLDEKLPPYPHPQGWGYKDEARLRGLDEKIGMGPLELIGLLPGSKPAKLSQGVPLTLAVAQEIYKQRRTTRFVIPVAPTLDMDTLAAFADPDRNPLIQQWPTGVGELVMAGDRPCLQTPTGLRVELWTEFPADDILSQCMLCLTTVGANTAQLGALAVPMIVLLPTQQLDAMRAWDGLPGLLANLPFFGSSLAKLINWLVLRQGRLFAWPNIWAGEAIVPELVGQLQSQDVAALVLDFLAHPEKLEQMADRLRAVRGQPGAAEKLAQLVFEELGARRSNPRVIAKARRGFKPPANS
ncbi:MAG: lipid-A-disaccharide synthase [Hormoscilla sp.]